MLTLHKIPIFCNDFRPETVLGVWCFLKLVIDGENSLNIDDVIEVLKIVGCVLIELVVVLEYFDIIAKRGINVCLLLVSEFIKLYVQNSFVFP